MWKMSTFLWVVATAAQTAYAAFANEGEQTIAQKSGATDA